MTAVFVTLRSTGCTPRFVCGNYFLLDEMSYSSLGSHECKLHESVI